MTKPSKRFVKISLTLTLLIILAYILPRLLLPPILSPSTGRILLRLDGLDDPSELIMFNGDGGNIQWLGFYFGSPAWSRDGRFVAVGCSNPNESHSNICVLDMSTLVDMRTDWSNHSQSPSAVVKLPIPDECGFIAEGSTAEISGLLSISWSGTGDRIAFVCRGMSVGDSPTAVENRVCILSLDGQSNCWNKDLGKNVYRVSWSPKEDLIAISGLSDYESMIYLVDSDGLGPRFLTRGWSAEWAPDGNSLAFIAPGDKDSQGNYWRGIGVINENGTDQRWLYFPEPSSYEPIILICSESVANCRLTWSPEGRYVAFLAINNPPYNTYKLYRLDVRSGEVISLVQPRIFHSFMEEPAWGPENDP